MPSADSRSGPQTLNHQSLPHSSSTLRIARRKSSASLSDSSTSAVPPGGSIIAADTSHDAMIAYCGDVDVCIRYASLKIGRSSFRVLRVLHDDLRRLRDARQQLVRRVRGEDDRVLAARTVLPDRVHVAVELVERRVRQPRLVEVQRLDAVVQHALQHLDVVGDAVVRALRERQDARLLVLGLARERIGLDAPGDVLRLEFVERDRPDDAEVVARGRQEHRESRRSS